MRVFNSPFQKIYSAGILFLLLLILLPHCSAWHKHRRRSTFSDLRFIDFKFEEEPQRNVSALESLVLDCQYVVRNDKYVRDVRIEWKRDGAIINEKTSPRTKVLSNGSLSLLGVTSSDEGTYQCYVHVSTVGIYGNDSQMWTFVSRKAQIRVADLPKFDVQPTDKSVVKGQPAAFQCLLATAVHSAQLHHITTWYHNGIPVNLEGGDFLILPLTNTLEISSTQPRHDGDYKCTVQGAGKRRTSQTARLTVTAETDSIAQSDITFVTSPRLQEVDEGDSFVLECLAASRHRQPEVRWLKDSRQVLVDGVRLRRVGVASLLVRLATVEDSGLYTCRVSNSIDSVDKAVSVVVRTAPRITTPPPSWKSAVETADVELECAASGRPAPRVSWLKNGETIIPSEYFVIEANRLRILGLVKSDQAVYQCVAENEIGSEQASSQLLINVPDASSMVAASTGDPIVSSPPLGLRASSIGSRFLLLNWDKPLQENGNLVRYHIFFKEADSDRERMANSSTTSLSLTALQPATMYIVRVAAENEAGIGRFSEAVKVMTNKEQAVPGRVTSLAATALGPQTIEVHWRAPAGGQPAQRYKLFYTSHASRKDGEDEDNKKETQITTTATSYTLHGMEKYMEYLIRVEADGENGSGLSSEVVKVRTLSDKPSLPPRSIAAEADSSTSLRVSWSEAEENSVNGELTGYRIRYKTNARGSKVNNLAIDANVREYTLAGLEPGTQYLLRMAVINHNGTGTFSDWITVETPTQDKEERILSAPREIRPHAGVDYIFVAWLPPADETNLVRGYQVGWGLGIPDTDSVKVAATVTQHKISGLLSGRDYVVSLRAFNSQGNGFPIYETVRTLTKRAEGDGGSPLNDDGRQAEDEARSEEVNTPLGVRAETLSATSIRVLWIADVDAFNALYTVRYSTSADGNQQRYSNTSDPWAVVEGLRPATEYELAVRTVAGSGQVSGWSLVTRNRTLAAAPSSSPRDLTVLPAESGDPHSVSLHWQPPKYANGEIEEYVIYYTDRESLADKDWIINYVGGERLSHQISNLLPYAAYFFKIQARNEKGYGPFSPVQGYTPLGGVLLSEESRENRHRVGDGSAQWWGEKLRKAVSANPMYMALAVALMIILVLCVVLAVMCCIKRSTGRTPKNAYNTGKKTATSVPGRQEAPVDLWIQPNNSTGVHMRAGASDYMVDGLATAHLTALNGEDIDTSSPPPPRYQHLQGTLSRSYHQSSSSLEGGAPRQRTPQVVYTGTGRHQPIAKIDFCESSPYGSSSALGSATPPPLPPLQAPPSGPPSSVADGYRTLRGTPQSSTSNALRSFAQHLSGAAPPPTSAGRTIVVASGGRYVPVGRAAAQPRVNVANIYSPYASCSSNVCSEDAEKKTDGDIELSETPSKPSEKEKDSSHPMHPSNSTEELNAQMENLDTMIDDLQALQHEFGVTS